MHIKGKYVKIVSLITLILLLTPFSFMNNRSKISHNSFVKQSSDLPISLENIRDKIYGMNRNLKLSTQNGNRDLTFISLAKRGAMVLNSFGTLIERKWNGYIYYPTYPLFREGFPREQWLRVVEDNMKSTRLNEINPLGYSELIPQPINATGNLTFLAILVEFQDVKFQSGHSVSYYDTILNDKTNPSLRTFYLENSYGLLNISVDVVGPVTSSKNMSYYGEDGSGIDNLNGPIYELAREAVNLADGLVNYSKYDNNGDGYADAVLIIHAGTGQEYSGNSTDIWSHRWSITSPPFLDGVYIKDYSMQPEHYPPKTGYPSGASILGVITHEFGHILGLPDFYDIDYSSEGIGNWGLMGGGGWDYTSIPGDNPSHLSAWSKIFLGFKKPVPLTPLITDINNLSPVETGGDILMLPIPGHFGEYFLLEYRSTTSGALFDKGLPGSGLMIWHIDENVAFMDWDNDGLNNWDDNDVNSNETHYMIDIEEYDYYDGTQELELGTNRGESTDVWFSTTTGFNDTTTPNASAYDGTPSGLWISDISSASSTISFSIQASTIEIRHDLSIQNASMVLKSNLTIVRGSNMDIVNSTVVVGSSFDNQFNMIVSNGTLSIVNSTVNSLDPLNAYSIWVYSSSLLRLENSNITDSDYNDSNLSNTPMIGGLSNSTIIINNSLIARSNIGLETFNPFGLTVFESAFINNTYGLLEQKTNSSLILYNKFVDNTFGLFLNYSLGARIEGNIFINDNPVLWGDSINQFIHVIQNNTVNNKTLHYIEGQLNVYVPSDGGPVIIINSRQVQLSKTKFTSADVPIQIAFSREVFINESILSGSTQGIRVINSQILNLSKVEITNTTLGMYLLNATYVSLEKSTIANNNGDGIVVAGLSQNIKIELSNVYSNKGFGLLNKANDSVNATLNWWGDPSGPEYKNISDPIDPEEIWGNVSYNPWLAKKYIENFIEIYSLSNPNKVLVNTTFYINVTTNYTFTSPTLIKVVLIDSNTNTVVSSINETLVGNGSKQYNFSVKSKPFKTTMKFSVKTYYNSSTAGWIETSSKSTVVSVLPPEPAISITSPADGSQINGKSVTVSWSIVEGYYPTTKVEIRLDSNNWIDVSSSTSYTFNNLTNGTHTITVRVTDSANHQVLDSITITSVQIKPSIDITSPTNNSVIVGGNVTLTWIIQTGTFQISKVEVSVDGGQWIDVTGSTNYTITNLSIGLHNVTVKVTDTEGYTDSDTIYFQIISPKPPVIDILEPSDGATVNSTEVTVKWSVTKGTYNISKIEIRLDTGSWIDVTGRTSYKFTNLSEGDHTVYMRIIDEKGNVDTDSVSFTVNIQQSKDSGSGGGAASGIVNNPILLVALSIVLIVLIIVLSRRKR